MKKVTKHHMQIFREEFLKQCQRFSLGDWKVRFTNNKDLTNYATCGHVSLEGRYAYVNLTSIWPDEKEHDRRLTDQEIRNSAKHEALHLLLTRLYHFALERFVEKREVDEAEEAIVRTLEKLI